VRVLPDPVGAATRVERPLRICGQAAAWASVGAGNALRNQLATAGWRSSSALAVKEGEPGLEAGFEAGRETVSEVAPNAGSKLEESEDAPRAVADVEAEVMLA